MFDAVVAPLMTGFFISILLLITIIGLVPIVMVAVETVNGVTLEDSAVGGPGLAAGMLFFFAGGSGAWAVAQTELKN